MTPEQNAKWSEMVDAAVESEKTDFCLAAGYLCFESLRKLNPRQFADLHARNLKCENFDEMVRTLVVEGTK